MKCYVKSRGLQLNRGTANAGCAFPLMRKTKVLGPEFTVMERISDSIPHVRNCFIPEQVSRNKNQFNCVGHAF